MKAPRDLSPDEVGDLVARTREKFDLPALHVALINLDDAPQQTIQGTRVAGRDNPATVGDFFHIGSCSKSVLAVLAGQLIEAGQLTWDTKFFAVLPELAAGSNPEFADITMTDLFRGIAGILRFDSSADAFPDIDPATPDAHLEFARFLVAQPAASRRVKSGSFKPLHSNASFTMIAAMLERLSGDSWATLIRRTLADDLKLSVHIGWPNDLGADQPWGHHGSGDKVEQCQPGHEYRLHDLIAPAGNLSLSADSFARYTQFHLRGLCGRSDYLEQATFEQMHFGHPGQSMGIGNASQGGQRFSVVNGSAGTFFAQAIMVPGEEFGFTILSNAASGGMRMPAFEWLTATLLKKRYGWWWQFWV